jgi:DNA polymerase-1
VITLLIDADIVAFKHASTNEEKHDWGNGVITKTVSSMGTVALQVDAQLAEWKARWKADEIIVCLSCPHEENFRLGVLPSYKGNRDYDNRPLLLTPIKEYLASAYRTYARPTLEADDVMGILSTHPTLVPGRKVIVSEDKDMKTIPGWLWNPAKDPKPWKVSEEEADWWHLLQAVTGDDTDHYKGAPGYGLKAYKETVDAGLKYQAYEYIYPRKKTTEIRWEKVPSASRWESVVAIFEKAGLTEEDALVQARVARICRASDYDFKEKKVKLWTPQ